MNLCLLNEVLGTSGSTTFLNYYVHIYNVIRDREKMHISTVRYKVPFSDKIEVLEKPISSGHNKLGSTPLSF